MRARALALILLAVLGGSLVVAAALNGRSTAAGQDTAQGVGGGYGPGYQGRPSAMWYGSSTWPASGAGGYSGIAAILNYLHERGINIPLGGSNITISRSSISGSLVLIKGGIAHIQEGSSVVKVAIPNRLFDGERVLYLDEAIFLGYLRKGDSVSISAVNITAVSASGGRVASIYIALEVQDTSTGKRLTIAYPVDLG